MSKRLMMMKISTLHRTMLAAAMLLAAMALALAIACAPASNDGGMSMEMEGMEGMAGMEVDESNLKLKIGQASPPFAMVMADGTQVSSEELADQGQPAHLFWFATW